MIKTLRYAFMAMLMFVCGTAFADVITLNAANFQGDETATVTQDGITLTIDKGTSTSGAGNLYNGQQFRIYKGNTLTVSSTVGNITQIVFTCTANGTTKQGPGCFAAQDGYTYEENGKTGTWVGNAASVNFTAESNQVRATTIEVTVGGGEVGPTKKAADLAFSEGIVNYEVGTAFTAPTFTKATTATVAFASDNEAVATVNAEGVIAVTGAEGKAVITATSEANDEYNEGSATCTVYVYHMNVYKKATTVESGKKYLIVAQRDNKTYYAIPGKETYTYGYLNTTTPVDGYVEELSVKSSYDDTFTFEDCEDGFSIKDCYGRYLYMDSEHASFQFGAEAQAWTVEAAENGTFTITNNSKFIQWGSGTYTTFGAYAEKQDGTVLPMLFVADDATAINGVQTTVKTQNNVRYNIAGQRVAANYKGIVIVNGKKMLQK